MRPVLLVCVLLACACGRQSDVVHSARVTATPVRTATPSPAATATPALPHVAGHTIVIDPGHDGGNAAHRAQINRLVDAVTLRKPCDTVGASTNSGYPESAFTLDVSLRLAALLRSSGATVVLTRTTDTGWGPCITERAAIGNRARAGAAISIHADGGPATGRGFHVIEPARIAGYTDGIVAPSRRLGSLIAATYARLTGLPPSTYAGTDGIDVRNDLGGLNLSRVPKVFVECANMRNTVDASLIVSPAFRARIAAALAESLDDYFS